MKHGPGREGVPPADGPVDRTSLIDRAAGLGVALTDPQAAKLVAFEDLLRSRAVALGMVGRGDAGSIRERHVLDCLRAVSMVRETDGSAYDLGSGAGLPGVAVAIACPLLRVALVEVRRRRAAFLELAIESLALGNASVQACRIEDLSEPVDVCFARALAPLAAAWSLCQRVIRPEGRLVYFAGRGFSPAEATLPGTVSRLVAAPALESSGPLVIIARQ